MKKVEAIFRHVKLHDVSNALGQLGIEGVTVTEVVGRGNKRGAVITYRGVTLQQAFVPHVKLEAIVANDEAEAVVEAIFQHAHTGQIGDGRVIVTDINSMLRIRTGEVDATDAEFVQHRSASHSLPVSNVEASTSLFAGSR